MLSTLRNNKKIREQVEAREEGLFQIARKGQEASTQSRFRNI